MNTLERIQRGSLFIRRWEKRLFACMISFNLWLDIVISYLLNSAEWSIGWMRTLVDNTIMNYTINKIYDLRDNVEFSEKLITLLAWASIITSIILWVQIIRSILFLYADFVITKKRRNKNQWLPIIAISIVNVIIAIVLCNIWLPL